MKLVSVLLYLLVEKMAIWNGEVCDKRQGNGSTKSFLNNSQKRFDEKKRFQVPLKTPLYIILKNTV
jgi:hypothetical protein